jgi:hypothetical protein
MGRLQAWWRKLTGHGVAAAAPPSGQGPAPRNPPPPDGLELADEPKHSGSGRAGAAGFDPYSSDAGYAKPHSWERVDHD